MITVIATGTITTFVTISVESSMLFVDIETIPLKGELASGDFILLMDFAGFVYESGHIAMQVPCEPNGGQLLDIVFVLEPIESDILVFPNRPMNMNIDDSLAGTPSSCVYHGDIKDTITDEIITKIILRNTSDDTVSFITNRDSTGHSVTINIIGEAK